MVNKYIKEQLFPTEVYICDGVLEEEYIDSMKEDILKNSTDKENWQSGPKLHLQPKYKELSPGFKIFDHISVISNVS